ncbi:MAG: carbon storage regulator [Planctomycetia bacterium]|nr:carbon storage regulator [Planctomycetia bacterium]
MLVLSRKENERIRLGDSIIVTIVRVSGDKVRLGIQAPPDVLVLRDELETFSKQDAPQLVTPLVTVVDLPIVPQALAG